MRSGKEVVLLRNPFATKLSDNTDKLNPSVFTVIFLRAGQEWTHNTSLTCRQNAATLVDMFCIAKQEMSLGCFAVLS